MQGLKDTLLNLIISAITGFDSMVAEAQSVLTTEVDGVWDSVLGISGTLKPFCYTVIGICMLIELAQVAQKVDVVTWEHGLKVGIKIVLARLCIDKAPIFLRACYNQAVVWINSALSAGDYTSLSESIQEDITNSLNNVTGLWTVLGLFVSTMLVALAVKVCGLMIEVIAFGRMFELYVYLAVSPLPCAFFPLGDGSGGGWSRITQRFLKSFIAVCLQGVMIMVCIRIFYSIVGSAFETMATEAAKMTDASSAVTELIYTMLMAAVVLVMAITKCGGWAKGIIDAA